MTTASRLRFVLKSALIVAFFPYPTIVPAQSAASTDTAASAALNPKAPGTVRIGIVLPANQLSGKGQLQDGEPLRTAELQLLRGPRLEAVPLQSILPEQAQQEGKLQGCDFVLTTTVAQQPAEKSNRFRRFTGRDMLHMATSAAQFMPVVGASSMVANLVMTSALSQATTLALTNAAQPVRADSDVTLTYKLTKTDGTMVLSTDEKAHTSSNGENILTPMLTSMSAKVAGAAKL